MKSSKKEIRVAIAGLGNCASSLVQGLQYYSKDNGDGPEPIGLIFKNIGGYQVGDIKVVSAFDVNKDKVAQKISKAIFAQPNNTKIFYKKVNNSNIVNPGPLLDGLSNRTKKVVVPHSIKKSPLAWKKSVVKELRQKKVDILISYLPVGSKKAAAFYAECAIEAGVSFANAIPVFICSDRKWSKRFKDAGIPCAGDDIKSQVGATIVHRVLVDLINKRGLKIDNTYQLNIGGNLDFMNMIDEERLLLKRKSKTEAITKNVVNQKFETKIGPSEYVPFLNDNKQCFIEINGKQFGGIPFKLELKLSVEDSPNSAGVMVDVIRLLKISRDRKLSGYQDFSCYYFKHPAKNYDDEKSHQIVKDFIA